MERKEGASMVPRACQTISFHYSSSFLAAIGEVGYSQHSSQMSQGAAEDCVLYWVCTSGERVT